MVEYGMKFVFGVTGMVVPGYRVEEKAGQFALAFDDAGTGFYIEQNDDEFRLHESRLATKEDCERSGLKLGQRFVFGAEGRIVRKQKPIANG